MNNFLQDTDSQSWPEPGLHSDLKDLTTSTEEQADAFKFRGESNPTRQARNNVSQIKDSDVKNQLNKLLSIIDKKISLAQQRDVDLSRMPPLHAHVDEDGSVLLEWIFSDFRVGFNIEPNPDDSGWHLVSNKTHNEYTASGQLEDMNKITTIFLNFIFLNI